MRSTHASTKCLSGNNHVVWHHGSKWGRPFDQIPAHVVTRIEVLACSFDTGFNYGQFWQ